MTKLVTDRPNLVYERSVLHHLCPLCGAFFPQAVLVWTQQTFDSESLTMGTVCPLTMLHSYILPENMFMA